jgi:hypothetical protein
LKNSTKTIPSSTTSFCSFHLISFFFSSFLFVFLQVQISWT